MTAFGDPWNPDILDFAFVRNLHFPTDAMSTAMREALPGAMRSYGSTPAALNQKMASFLRCSPDNVRVLHGSAQLLPILKRLVGIRPVLRPDPTFGDYTRILPTAAVYADKPGVDLDALDRAIPVDGVVLFVTPNSPTGSVIPPAWIHDCARRHGHTTFVADDSYIDFSDHPPLVDFLESDPVANLLVIKHLSPSLGVPGLRLGYVYTSNPEIIRVLDDDLPIWNLDAPAEYFLDLAIQHRADFAASLEQTRADRAQFVSVLEATPAVLRVHPSGGNFLMVDLRARDPILGLRVQEQLMARFRIDVEDVSMRLRPPAPRLRLAVRLPDEHIRFCEALSTVAATL